MDGGNTSDDAGRRPDRRPDRRRRWRRRFGIAALVAIAALWPLAASVEASPTLLAGLLLADVVVVLGFTVAWYCLVDLRLEPRKDVAVDQRRTATPASDTSTTAGGCLGESLAELAGWLVFAALAILGAELWQVNPLAAVVGVGVAFATVLWTVDAWSRRRHRVDGPLPGESDAEQAYAQEPTADEGDSDGRS